MRLSYGATTELFRAGHYLEIIAKCGTDDEAPAPLTPEHRILIAETLAKSDPARAEQIARRENQSEASPTLRSRCELVAGTARRRQAAFEPAVAHFQRAVQLARESGDVNQTAWADPHLFRFLAEVQPNDASVALLRDARTWVTRAADPRATAFMHQSIAMIEGSLGRFDEARRHQKISSQLLEQYPNAWISHVSAVGSSCMAVLECDYAAAARHIQAGRRWPSITGAVYLTEILENNEGHVLLFTGRFAAAEERLRRIVATTRNPYVEQCALEGLTRLYLAQDRLDECEGVLAQADAILKTDSKLATSVARWWAVTRVKLLLRRRLAARAEQEAVKEIARAKGLHDRFLVSALCCMHAEAAVAAGKPREAGRSLLVASEMGAAALSGRQAEFYHSVAAVLEGAAAPLAARIRGRAHAIWAQQGNRLGPLEDGHTGTVRAADETAATWPVELQPAAVTDALASAFDLAHAPRLLGAELRNAITTLDGSPHVVVEEANPSTSVPEPTDDRCTLPLGEQGGIRLTLVCKAPDDPLKAKLLSDVLRLGRAAVALEQARQEAKSRAALWPERPLDDRENALFLAGEMQLLLDTARRVASTNVPVLITGESGTGKEVLARTIHAYSARAGAAFVPFNCAAVPKEMLDSQLFGHRKGAFTGASDDFSGVIRAANGGTLFLDEIGDVTLDVQPKLLRFLELGDVHPIGAPTPVRADARVVAATNADVDMLVRLGRLREDLFYRLNIVRLHVPPLRERRVEIPALASHYLQTYARECRKGDLRFAEETMEYLLLYRWPGNVRQLANEMRRLAALAEVDAVMMPEHLSEDIAASRRTIPASDRVLETTEMVVRTDQPIDAAVEHVERAMIQRALKECHGNLERTAAMLGLSRKGLYLKRQRLGIETLSG